MIITRDNVSESAHTVLHFNRMRSDYVINRFLYVYVNIFGLHIIYSYYKDTSIFSYFEIIDIKQIIRNFKNLCEERIHKLSYLLHLIFWIHL